LNFEERPGLFLIGGRKCATTYLYEALRTHPEICFSNPKEPTFFMLDSEFNKGIRHYKNKYFPHYSNEEIVADARVDHLYLPWVPERIKKYFPNATILLVIRNPVDRAFSDYQHARRHGVEDLPFDEAVYEDYKRIREGKRLRTEQEKETFQKMYKQTKKRLYRMYLDGGYYASAIEKYLNVFGRDNSKFVLFSELINQTKAICNEVFDKIGLRTLSSVPTQVQNPSSVPKSYKVQKLIRLFGESIPTGFIPNKIKRMIVDLNQTTDNDEQSMGNITRLWLYEHFESHNKKMNDLSSKDLSHWFLN
jgi:hypothetical protein